MQLDARRVGKHAKVVGGVDIRRDLRSSVEVNLVHLLTELPWVGVCCFSDYRFFLNFKQRKRRDKFFRASIHRVGN